MAQATLVQIREFFGMSSTELAKEWRNLDENEKTFFKDEVAKVLGL